MIPPDLKTNKKKKKKLLTQNLIDFFELITIYFEDQLDQMF